ncbi:hypothetical protein ACLOJK_028107 [Asimina triloba]
MKYKTEQDSEKIKCTCHRSNTRRASQINKQTTSQIKSLAEGQPFQTRSPVHLINKTNRWGGHLKVLYRTEILPNRIVQAIDLRKYFDEENPVKDTWRRKSIPGNAEQAAMASAAVLGLEEREEDAGGRLFKVI